MTRLPSHSRHDDLLRFGALGAGIGLAWLLRAFLTRRTPPLVEREENRQSYRDATQEAGRLRALHEASVTLTSSLALEEVLQRVSDLSRALLDARYAALGVFNEAGRITLFITSGIDPHTRARIGSLPVGRGLLGHLMREGEPIRVPDIAAHPESVGFPPHHPPMKSLLGIPLRYKGELLGDLYLTEKRGGLPFDAGDEELLLLFGAQAAAALANARLAQQLEGMAVVEERQRFAMDLHDSIIQDIYAIGLTLQATAYQMEAHPEAARAQLLRSLSGLDEVIKDIRGYIVNLGPGRFGGKSLSLGLADLARESRLEGMLQVDVTTEEGVDLHLTTEQSSALFHIVREALSNAVKHARAPHVGIHAWYDAGQGKIQLEVADNGEGFEVPAEGFPEQHRGLRNMRQRARALGATLHVQSTPGKGTTLSVVLPTGPAAPPP